MDKLGNYPELEKEYKKKMKNAENIQTQLEDFKMSFIKRIKEDELEGELIKKQVEEELEREKQKEMERSCLLYTSPSPRDQRGARMPSSA